jgi:hypothetical protein
MKRPARANGALDGLNRAKPSLGNHPIGRSLGYVPGQAKRDFSFKAYAGDKGVPKEKPL